MEQQAKKASKILNYSLSASKIFLAILKDLPHGLTQAFFPPRYANKYGYNYLYKNYHTATSRLKKRGLIKKVDKIFKLTPKGEKEALFAFLSSEIKGYKPETPATWDGGWRIIFFDIPEKKRRHRDFLRDVLRAIGFKEFQKSVWIYPHPVPAFLRDLLFEESIKQYTRFITTESIEYDKDLRELFPETFFKNSK